MICESTSLKDQTFAQISPLLIEKYRKERRESELKDGKTRRPQQLIESCECSHRFSHSRSGTVTGWIRVSSVVAAIRSYPVARADRASGTIAADQYPTPSITLRCRRIVSFARRMHAGTHSNSVPLVSWPLAAPFCAKCAYFECLNLGGQSK